MSLKDDEKAALNIGFNGVTVLQSDVLPAATMVVSPDVYAMLSAQQEEQVAEENKPRILIAGSRGVVQE